MLGKLLGGQPIEERNLSYQQVWGSGIDVSGFLEHAVEFVLHLFPDGETVRFDHHAAFHVGVLRQIGHHHQFVVPAGIIFRSGGQLCRHAFGIVFVL
jgi:hypothetical protein